MKACFLYTFGLLMLVCIGMSNANGHQLSTAYLKLSTTEQSDSLDAQVQLQFYDLERAIGVDSDLDGELRWHEVLQNQSRINAFLLRNLTFGQGQQGCNVQVEDNLRVDNHFNEGYLVIHFVVQCPSNISQQSFQIDYRGIFKQDPNHKILINIEGLSEDPDELISALIDKNSQQFMLNPGENYAYQTFVTYLYQGIVHIFIGIDHILFLVVLMMTCVLYRSENRWLPRQGFKSVMKTAAWIVTAFTLAHSITLTATVLGWISPSSRWVEVAIALSVLVTAINNVWPLIIRMGWVTFGFGLMHGMGFASVLTELGLSTEHQFISILAFNLGVEVGQFAILLFVLPVLYVLRNKRFYLPFILRAGSLSIGLIALVWTIQRI